MILLACTLLQGYSLDCKITGGVDVVFVSDLVKNQVYGFTTGNIIGGTDATSGTAMTFETLEQEIETASAIETITPSTENGTVFFEQAVALKFFGNTDEVRTLVDNLSKGRFTLIVRDQNGQDKIYGKQNGLRASEGQIGTGLAFGDLNGADIVLLGKEPEPANLVDLAGDGAGGSIDEFVINAAP